MNTMNQPKRTDTVISPRLSNWAHRPSGTPVYIAYGPTTPMQHNSPI